jgi:hypothetical protein
MEVTPHNGERNLKIDTAEGLVNILTGVGDNVVVEVNRDIDMVDVMGDDTGMSIMANGQSDLEMVATALTVLLERPITFNDYSWEFIGL